MFTGSVGIKQFWIEKSPSGTEHIRMWQIPLHLRCGELSVSEQVRKSYEGRFSPSEVLSGQQMGFSLTVQWNIKGSLPRGKAWSTQPSGGHCLGMWPLFCCIIRNICKTTENTAGLLSRLLGLKKSDSSHRISDSLPQQGEFSLTADRTASSWSPLSWLDEVGRDTRNSIFSFTARMKESYLTLTLIKVHHLQQL